MSHLRYKPRNAVLQDLLAERVGAGQEELSSKALHSGVSNHQGQLIGELVIENSCRKVLEIGLANGFSSLYILDALDQIGGGKLVSCDPFQLTDWNGRGLERIKAADFSSEHEFLAAPSWLALTDYLAEESIFDLVFIDGSHSFDNAFVDFYLADKLLRAGGLMIFDDVGWAAVERVVHYVVANRPYRIIRGISRDLTRRPSVAMIKRIGARVARTHRTPSPQTKAQIDVINALAVVAVEKTLDQSSEGSFQQF